MHHPRSLILALALAFTGDTASAAPAKVKPRTAVEQRLAKTYRAAMKRGRVATRRKKTAAAIKAFTQALVARPNDAQALAERGFARLSGKDAAGAEADLVAAERHAVSSTLHGQIWFNLGLLAERRDDAASARAAFALSNHLHPTAAALVKLGGAPACAATIDATRYGGDTYAGWQALAAAVAPDPAIATGAAARASLCGDHGCDGAGPWLIDLHASYEDATTLLVAPLARGRLLTFELPILHENGWCAWWDDATIDGGDPLRVHWRNQPQELGELVDDDGEPMDCDAPGVDCSDACYAVGQTDHDLFFDLAAGVQVLAIARPLLTTKELATVDEYTQPVTLTRGKDGVTLAGGDCDQQLRW